jgi:hypothetical protein
MARELGADGFAAFFGHEANQAEDPCTAARPSSISSDEVQLSESEMSDQERELRAACENPNPAIVAEMRSGAWQRRQQRNMRSFRRSVARWNTWRNSERVRYSEAPPRVDRPEVRPREGRARRRSTPTRGDPDPEPPLSSDRLRHAEILLAWPASLEPA